MNSRNIIFIFIFSLQFLHPAVAQWKPVDLNLNQIIYGIHFPSDSIGYAAGTSGTLLKTIDQGENWQILDLETNLDFHTVFFNTPDTGFVGADSTYIFKTTDGGQSWHSVQLIPDAGQVKTIYFINEQIGFACGIGGSIYKTIDGGNSWQAKPGAGLSLHFPTYDTGYAVSGSGVFKTTDQGELWERIAERTGTSNDSILGGTLEAVYFLTAERGFLGGWYNGVFSETKNGGFDWHHVLRWDVRDIYFPNDKIGYAVGSAFQGGSLILKTNDAGVTWNQQLVDSISFTLHSVDFIDEDIGFAAGGYLGKGFIYKTINGGGDILNTIPEKGNIESMKVFPNPFRDVFSIETANNKNIKRIRLFNSKGKEIKVEIKKELKLIHVKSIALPAGIYFLVIESSEALSTIRLIHL